MSNDEMKVDGRALRIGNMCVQPEMMLYEAMGKDLCPYSIHTRKAWRLCAIRGTASPPVLQVAILVMLQDVPKVS